MNFNIAQYIPTDFNNNSRVWVYQNSRLFTADEIIHIEQGLKQFAVNWKSHGADVKGYAHLLFDQFIVIIADETATGVSGCSTDSSVRVVKEIEQQFNVQLFERQNLAFIVQDKIQLIPLSQLEEAINKNIIDGNTLYFNNLVQTKEELLNNWIIPVKNSWLSKRYKFPEVVIG